MINEQEIHIHNYPTDSKGGASDKSSSSSSDGQGSSSSNDTQTNNSNTATSGQNNQTSQGLQKQNSQVQVGKVMDSRQSDAPKKKDEKGMKDFKEVFIRNHIRKYKRKPAIGLMKQTFGVHS